MSAVTLTGSDNVEKGTSSNPLITSPSSGATTQNVFVTNGAGNPVPISNASQTVASADGTPASTQLVAIGAFDGTNIIRLRTTQADGNDGTLLGPASLFYLFNGASYDRPRTPAIFKTATATAAGNTAIWTPTTGKKFRLMAVEIMVTANSSAASPLADDITLQDGTNPIGLGLTVFLPGSAGTTFGPNCSTGWMSLGNGYLSQLANNVLNVNLPTALATGRCRVVAIGTEE